MKDKHPQKPWLNQSKEEAKRILTSVLGESRYRELALEYKRYGPFKVRSWVQSLMLISLGLHRP